MLADAGSIPAASTKFPAVSVIFAESRPLDALPRKHFLETTLTSYLLGGRVYTARKRRRERVYTVFKEQPHSPF